MQQRHQHDVRSEGGGSVASNQQLLQQTGSGTGQQIQQQSSSPTLAHKITSRFYDVTAVTHTQNNLNRKLNGFLNLRTPLIG